MTVLTIEHLENLAYRQQHNGPRLLVGRCDSDGTVYASCGHGVLIVSSPSADSLTIDPGAGYSPTDMAEHRKKWDTKRTYCNVSVAELKRWAGRNWKRIKCDCTNDRVIEEPEDCKRCHGSGKAECGECGTLVTCHDCGGEGGDDVNEPCLKCRDGKCWPIRNGSVEGRFGINRALVARYIATFPSDGMVRVVASEHMERPVIFECGTQLAAIMRLRLDDKVVKAMSESLVLGARGGVKRLKVTA